MGNVEHASSRVGALRILRILICGLLALALGPTTARGAEQVVFGPKTYERLAQRPDLFHLPPDVTGPFRVHIKNGRPDGRDRVDSGWLYVNGELVAGPLDFDLQRYEFDRPVTLGSMNRVSVILSGGRSVFIEATFFGHRPDSLVTNLAPNPLSIEVGALGQLTATFAPAPFAPGSVELHSEDENVAAVPASVAFAEGQTEVLIPVSGLSEGITTIRATLNGGSATATVRVTPGLPRVVSLVPPSLAITEGASGTFTVNLSAAPAVDTDVTVTSSDPDVANVPGVVTVSQGELQAPIRVDGMAPGFAQVTVSLNGSSASSAGHGDARAGRAGISRAIPFDDHDRRIDDTAAHDLGGPGFGYHGAARQHSGRNPLYPTGRGRPRG